MSELRRRNVFRMAALYAVSAWLIVQVADVLIDLAKLPDWIGTTILWLLAIGFPIALAFSWFYEITPEGISLERDIDPEVSITHVTGRRLDFIVISLLCAAVILLAYDKWWTQAPPDNSIAVLPFSDMSPNGDHKYLSNGLAEELLNLLANVPGLRVTSRTSSFSFEDKLIEIPEIAAALNVAYVLEGSVRTSGDRIRVTAQLIETGNDVHVWSQTFDRQLVDIFEMQDEIAALVIESLKIALVGEAPVATPTDPEAFSMYLQARHLWRQGSDESIRSAYELIQQAIDIDPDYAPFWVALSNVYTYQVGLGQISAEEGHAKARKAALHGLEIDPNNALALSSLGWDAMIVQGDYHSAATHFNAAHLISPEDPTLLGDMATLAAILGRLEDAVELLETAIDLDPIDSAKFTNLGAFYLAANRLDEAEVAFAKALELSPGDIWTLHAIVQLRILQGRADDALALLDSIEVEFIRLRALPMIYDRLGRSVEADQAIEHLKAAEGSGITAYEIAEVYAYTGDSEQAFSWLERGIDSGVSMSFVRLSPFLQAVSGDDRWQEILARVGLSDDQISDIELE
jgi:TolB-like protein/Flp pilus assembly protein TadD